MDQTLITKLEGLPADLKAEVLDFIDFLLQKRKAKAEKSGQVPDENGEPENMKVPEIPYKKAKPQFGSGKGTFTMKPDFDEPLDDFADYM